VVGEAELQGTVPPRSGTVQLTGLNAPVEVVRDHLGVRYIRAASPDDAFLAQGYVHAQDRLWQMEVDRWAIGVTIGPSLTVLVARATAASATYGSATGTRWPGTTNWTWSQARAQHHSPEMKTRLVRPRGLRSLTSARAVRRSSRDAPAPPRIHVQPARLGSWPHVELDMQVSMSTPETFHSAVVCTVAVDVERPSAASAAASASKEARHLWRHGLHGGFLQPRRQLRRSLGRTSPR
jgi:hypothetical protein